ncbi:hypothetical protein DPMN_014532 [Dreissena polymorpha]|uniref:Uncharacterized protein n=1 Tax=Dreissena polymorpha TaxID=45954 RepID=A0A9D4N9C5_DREPO|nr:hypothetical protein DPMN_014532 [Dreissena polymorpha]
MSDTLRKYVDILNPRQSPSQAIQCKKQSGDMSDTLTHSVNIPDSLLHRLYSVRNCLGTC